MHGLLMLFPEKGEEIYMSYGTHPNDLLLIECRLPPHFL
jgi:hypothetical protein